MEISDRTLRRWIATGEAPISAKSIEEKLGPELPRESAIRQIAEKRRGVAAK